MVVNGVVNRVVGPGARRRTGLVAVAVLVLGVSTGLVSAPEVAHAQAAAASAGSFRALTPARLLDTRTHSGGSRVAARGTLHLLVLGRGGVPASKVTTVLLSVVATRATAAGQLTAYADGTPRPVTSNVNFRPGRTVSNQVTSRVGSNGRVALYNASGGAVDLVADVYGYVAGPAPVASGSFVATAPVRLLDTRTSPTTASPGAHATVALAVAGHGGIPASGVGAVALTVTAAAPAATGSIDVYPAGGPTPPQPTTSFDAQVTTAGATVVPLGAGGAVTLANDSPGRAPLVVDVVGYFASGAAGPTGMYVPVPATTLRLSDPGDTVAGRSAGSVNLSSGGVVPDHPPMAVLLAVSVTAKAAGFVTPSPNSVGSLPLTSALSARAGSTVSGLLVAPLGTNPGASIRLWNGSTASVTVHVAVLGFFVAAAGGAAVTGRVTSTASGAGLAGVVVRLYDPDPDMADEFGLVYRTATTRADGRYTIAGVGNGGDYMLCFDPRNVTGGPAHTAYAGQCWQAQPYGGGVDFPPHPTVVHTAVGATTSGIDAVLTSTSGGSVSGRITGAGGVPLAGVRVESGRGVTGTSGADGRYHLDGEPVGTDTVHVDPGSVHGTGAPYGYLPADTAPVTVTAGADTPGVDARLAAQSRVAGHLRTSSGAHFGSGYVEVVSAAGNGYFGDIDVSDGSYQVTGFTGGTYRVCFHGARPDAGKVPAHDWADECYRDVAWPSGLTIPSGATALPIGAGAQRTVDATLDAAGSIAGTVRSAAGGPGVGGVEIDVFDPDTHALLRTASSESDGTYLVSPGLPASSPGYLVCVNGDLAHRASACYADAPWPSPSLPSGAVPVTVAVGAVHSGVDVVLPPA